MRTRTIFSLAFALAVLAIILLLRPLAGPGPEAQQHIPAAAKVRASGSSAAATPGERPVVIPQRQREQAAPPAGLEDLLAKSQLIHVREEAPPFAGASFPGLGKRRIEIYRTNFRYPLIRVERSPEGKVLAAMAADHLVAKRLPGMDATEFSAQLASRGLEVRHQLYGDSGYLVTAPGAEVPTALETIAAALVPDAAGSPAAWCAPDGISGICAVPNDPGFIALSGMDNPLDADIDAPEAWDLATDASSVVVAVIDSGIDLNHRDLKANIWTNPGEIPGNGLDDDGNGLADDIHGYDFFNSDPDPSDDFNHGSHCAGILGAVGNNHLGVAGVAWSARMMAPKVLGAEGFGYFSMIVEGITYADRMGARITSNSYTGTDEEFVAAAFATAADRGSFAVVASGNDGFVYQLPETRDYFVRVAATDAQDQLADFTARGIGVELAAPGVDIYSTVRGGYAPMSGTSMAAPHVAGACALLLARRPGLSVAGIQDHLLASVDRLPQLAGQVASGGRLNLHRLIAGATGDAPPLPLIPPLAAILGQAWSYQIPAVAGVHTYHASNLPPGLTLDTATGLISGAPLKVGNLSFQLRVTNNSGSSGLGTYTLYVGSGAPFFTSAATASGAVLVPFQHSILCSAEVSTLTAMGLPPGLQLDAVNRLISGTPQSAGVFPVSLTVGNPLGSATQTLVISISPAVAPQFAFIPGLSATRNQSWSFSPKASPAPTRFAASGLPAGLQIDPGTGKISGTPSTTGSYNVRLEAENSAGIGEVNFTLSVNSAAAPVLGVPESLSLRVGSPFYLALSASNSPVSFSAGNLPPWLAFDGSAISGTLPPVPGSYRISLSATNASGTCRRLLELIVLPALPVITSPGQVTAILGQPFIYEITANPPDAKLSVLSLPPGLRWEPGSPRILGVFLDEGEVQASLRAESAGGVANMLLKIRVVLPTPVISSPAEAYVVAGEPFVYSIIASNRPESYTAAPLPAGLSLDSVTGRISGVVSNPGEHSIQVSATNPGGSASSALHLTVHQNPTRVVSFTPTTVVPGDWVTITGGGFTGATDVFFSHKGDYAIPAAEFEVNSDTQIRAKAPYMPPGSTVNSLSHLMVLAPRGLAVTFPADTTQVTGPFNLSGGSRSAWVKTSGNLSATGGGLRVVVDNGGAAHISSGASHLLLVGSGGSIDITAASAVSSTIFYSPAATVACDPTAFQIFLREVSAVRATIVPQLLSIRGVPPIDSGPFAFGFVGEPFTHTLGLEDWVPHDQALYELLGPLPPGLELNSGIGVISGYPTLPGVYEVALRASTPSYPGYSYFTLKIIVEGAPVPVITSPVGAEGKPGISFAYQVTAANSPMYFAAQDLPPGLGIDHASGLISGTPTAAGIFHSLLEVSNAYGSSSRMTTFFFGASPLAVDSFSPQLAEAGSEVRVLGRGLADLQRVYFVNRDVDLVGDLGHTVVSDSEIVCRPPRLSFGSQDNTPLIVTTPAHATVTFPSDAVRYNTSGSVTVNGGGKFIVIGAGANVTIFGGGGSQKIYVESGGSVAIGSGGGNTVFLEDNASLVGTVALLVRSPTSTALSQAPADTFQVPSLSRSSLPAGGSLLAVYSMSVILTGDASGQEGVPFSFPMEIDRGSAVITKYSATGLPPGLTISPSSGTICGVPSAAGIYAVALEGLTPKGPVRKDITLTITPTPVPRFAGPWRIDAAAGAALDAQLAAVNGPVSFSASGLPSGLTLAANGRLSGSVSQAGVWTVGLTIAKPGYNVAATLVVAIASPLPQVTQQPPITATNAPVLFSGSGLDSVTTVRFKDRDAGQGDLATIAAKNGSALTAVCPALSFTGNFRTIPTLFSASGATVCFPNTGSVVPAGEGTNAGYAADFRVPAGATLLANSGPPAITYAEAGAFVILNNMSGLIYAEDGAQVWDEGNGGGTIVAGHNATLNLVDSSRYTVVRVPGLRLSPVADYLSYTLKALVTSPAQAEATLFLPFQFNVTAVNSPTSFSATGLPPGLSINAPSGVISGTPTAPGIFTVQLTAKNSAGSYTTPLTLAVSNQDSPLSGDKGDLDGDSICNLLEHAAKLNLNARNAPSAVASATRVGGDYRFTYRRIRGSGSGSTVDGYVIEGLRYTVETSSDAKQWSTGLTHVQEVGTVLNNGDGSESVTVRILLASRQVFARLKVERVTN